MTNPSFPLSRRSLFLLVASVSVAFALGSLHSASYRHLHRLDCEAASARRHPGCVSQVMLLLNGRISTRGGTDPVEALAARGGEILATGDTDELKRQFPDAIKIDLNGHLALPGFHDSRVHLLEGGLGFARLNLEAAADRASTLEMVATFAKSHPDDPWILGQGWSAEVLGDPAVPRNELDAVVRDRPVFLWCVDHQSALVNSRGLEALGIDRRSPEVSGGRIARDRAGVPTGLLEAAAAEIAFARVVAGLPTAFQKQALLAAQEYLLSQGITRVGDLQGHDLSELIALGELYEEGLWRLRVRAHPPLTGGVLWTFPLFRSAAPDTLEVGGPALKVDGSPSARHAAFSVEYPDGSPRVPPAIDAAALARALTGARAAGPMLDTSGDVGLETILTGLEAAPGVPGPLVSSPLWSDAAMVRAAARGAVPVLSPAGSWCGRGTFRGMVPAGVISQCYRYQSLLTHGLTPVIGSGWPDGPASPLLQLRAAVSAPATTEDPPSTGEGAPEPLSLEEALAAYSANPARAIGRDGREGSLEVGRLADLVVLDRDILKRAPSEVDSAQVVMTVVGGEVVWRREGGLQFRVDAGALYNSPPWIKVLARQYFLIVLLILAILNWPVLVLTLWIWERRPRPEPLKVIAGAPERP